MLQNQPLTDGVLARVASEICAVDFEHHAIKYMNMSQPEMHNLRYRGQSNLSFNREVLTAWRNRERASNRNYRLMRIVSTPLHARASKVLRPSHTSFTRG